jgi:hypothetical protein
LCLTYTSAEEISDKMSGMKTLTSHRHPSGTPAVAVNANRFWPTLKIRAGGIFSKLPVRKTLNSFFPWWAVVSGCAQIAQDPFKLSIALSAKMKSHFVRRMNKAF